MQPRHGDGGMRMRLSQRWRDGLLHFGDGDHRELLHEEQEPHEEPPEAPEQNQPVDERRRVGGPLPRLELVRERRIEDREPLEPHPEVDEQRDGEQPGWITTQLLEEERKRDDHVAREDDPLGPPPLAEHAREPERMLRLSAAVPPDEEL